MAIGFPGRRRPDRTGWPWIAGLAALAIAGLMALFVYGVLERGPVPAANAPVAVTPAEIAVDPSRYEGQTVRVFGEIDRIVGARSFTIGGDGFVGGVELLVVTAEPIEAVPGRPPDFPFLQTTSFGSPARSAASTSPSSSARPEQT